MFKKISTLFENLEDPDYPLLGPTLKGLKFLRMRQANSISGNFHVNYYVHIFLPLFVVSQYIELYLIRNNLELAVRNLSFTMLSTVCLFKGISFMRWEKYWNSIFEYVTSLEKQQSSKEDAITASIIAGYTKYGRRLSYFYWCLVTATVFMLVSAPLVGYLSSPNLRYLINNGTAPYPEILSSWFPFDRTRGFGYCVSVLVQSTICAFGAGIVAYYDSVAVILISFFNGQLKLLSRNCARLFGEDGEFVGYNEAVKRIRASHEHHVNLVKFSSLLNSLLSPVMFMYVIICSLMICASAIQLVKEGTETMQRIWISEYLVALISQLFLYCWHSNEVLYMSNKVEEGVYASAWWSQEVRIRRNVILLTGQLRKRIVFKAGPFTDLSLPTFIAILKGAYSYYTLLGQKDN